MHIDLSPRQLERIVLDSLRDNYGLEGSLSRLGGENLNYLVQTDSGERFVFKIVDEDMPSEVVAMEFRAIEHALSSGIQMDFPKIIRNLNGKIETGIFLHKNERYRSRLLHFVNGKILEQPLPSGLRSRLDPDAPGNCEPRVPGGAQPQLRPTVPRPGQHTPRRAVPVEGHRRAK